VVARVVIDPFTRIEGHLRIELELKDVATTTGTWQFVDKAYSGGMLFRGFEIFLKGRDPRDAFFITQRICGVCPAAHAEASNQALDHAFNAIPTPAATLIRNIIQCAYYIYDHMIHTYLLVGPELGVICKYPPMVPPALGKKGIKLLGLGSSYAKCVEMQRKANEIIALWGGKFPHHACGYPGGVTVRLTTDRLSGTLARAVEIWEFVATTMINDLQKLVEANKVLADTLSTILGVELKRGLGDIGVGTGNFLSYGMLPSEDPDDYENDWMAVIEKPGRRKTAVIHAGAWDGDFKDFDHNKIYEYIKYSWYDGKEGYPFDGDTIPNREKAGAYSWIKAPRYNKKVYEVGPLARMVNTYGLKWKIPRVHPITGEDYGDFVYEVMNPKGSLIDRVAARVAKTLVCANALVEFTLRLKDYMGTPVVNYKEVPDRAEGIGLYEAPRGALGHWVKIENKVIKHYQCVVPSTWNLSPRDSLEQPGPVETSLQCGTTWLPKNMSVKDVCDAIYKEADVDLTALGLGKVTWGEALATALAPLGLAELNMEPLGADKYNTSIAVAIVRSFDPCIACAVHVINKKK